MSIKKGKKQVYKVGQTVRVVQCMDKEYVGKIGTIAFLFRNGGIDVDLGDGLLVIASKVSPLKPKKSIKKIYKVPKCPNTVTGEHLWTGAVCDYGHEMTHIDNCKMYGQCRWCLLVDDRLTPNHQ